MKATATHFIEVWKGVGTYYTDPEEINELDYYLEETIVRSNLKTIAIFYITPKPKPNEQIQEA